MPDALDEGPQHHAIQKHVVILSQLLLDNASHQNEPTIITVTITF